MLLILEKEDALIFGNASLDHPVLDPSRHGFLDPILQPLVALSNLLESKGPFNKGTVR